MSVALSSALSSAFNSKACLSLQVGAYEIIKSLNKHKNNEHMYSFFKIKDVIFRKSLLNNCDLIKKYFQNKRFKEMGDD